MLETVTVYLWTALLATLVQACIVLAPGILLASIVHFQARFIERRALLLLGSGWYLALFGWLGTIIHELGHAVFCVIFRHRIIEMKLFSPDPETGTLGYVKHAYNRTSIFQQAGNFFIGIGPILLGMTVTCLILYYLLGINPFNAAGSLPGFSSPLGSWNALFQLLHYLQNSSVNLFTAIFSRTNFLGWRLYVFLYLAFTIGSSAALSPPDIKAAVKGFVIILALLLVFNLATVWIGDFTLTAVNGLAGFLGSVYTIMFLIILLNTATVVMVLLPLSLRRTVRA